MSSRMCRITSAPGRLTSSSWVSSAITRARSRSADEMTTTSSSVRLTTISSSRSSMVRNAGERPLRSAASLSGMYLIAISQPQVCARILRIAAFDHLDRHVDEQHGVEVPAAGALHLGHPLAAQPQLASALAAGRHLQLHRPVGGRRLHRRAEHRLADRDRQVEVEVLAAALQMRVRPDAGDDVEVAGRRTADPGAALARQPDARAVVDARGDLDVQALGLLDPTRPVALRTRPRVDAPSPAAARTAPLERHRPRRGLHASATVALRARGALTLRARAMAGRTLNGLGERDRRRGAADRAQQIDLERVLEIGPALRRRAAAEIAVATEDVPEDV